MRSEPDRVHIAVDFTSYRRKGACHSLRIGFFGEERCHFFNTEKEFWGEHDHLANKIHNFLEVATNQGKVSHWHQNTVTDYEFRISSDNLDVLRELFTEISGDISVGYINGRSNKGDSFSVESLLDEFTKIRKEIFRKMKTSTSREF